ncbi:MAG: DUF3149 domain-containing protein [Sulfurimicrobium sp.]|jgi:hypothetical protein|nr:DUF3149 domain-containing protein [Sulfurimicrobium sp.]
MVIMDMLFKTEMGLLSMFTIGFVLLIAAFFIIWFIKKSGDPNA